MKNLFLIFSLIFSFNVFATGNTTMVPVSTQKVSNATLTCPTGKWCRVRVNASINISTNTSTTCSAGASTSAPASLASFEIIIKSGETISGSVSSVGASVSSGFSTLSISVSGSTIYTISSSLNYGYVAGACNPTFSNTTSSYYGFYSMEYWN